MNLSLGWGGRPRVIGEIASARPSSFDASYTHAFVRVNIKNYQLLTRMMRSGLKFRLNFGDRRVHGWIIGVAVASPPRDQNVALCALTVRA